jgi:osmotically-inducible protein OsmY
MRHVLVLSLVAGLPLVLSGCVGLAATGASSLGVAAAEERSMGTIVDDKTIYAEITHLFLQSDVNDLLTNVDVRVNEGRILLTGVTPKPETAVEAVRLAWLAQGVREVINEIRTGTQNNTASYARDQWIETQIEARLLATKGVMSINYTVEVVEGVVYLLGIAQNQQELKNVTHIASLTKGVRRVVSYVRLKTDPPPQIPAAK